MNYPKILIWGVFLQWTFILLSTWVGLLEEKNMDDVNAEILNILSSTGLTHSQNMWLVLTSFSVLLFFVSMNLFPCKLLELAFLKSVLLSIVTLEELVFV